MTQWELIKEFYGGALRGRASNMYIKGNILYGQEEEIILAWRSKTAPQKKSILINGDRFNQYEISTDPVAQRAKVESVCKAPRVSFSGLRAAGLLTYSYSSFKVLDSEQDQNFSVYRKRGDKNRSLYKKVYGKTRESFGKASPVRMKMIDDNEVGEFTPAESGNVSASKKKGEEYYFVGYWHVLGGVLFEVQAMNGLTHLVPYAVPDKLCKMYFLSGVDENSYFLSLLSKPAKKIGQAYDGLKPDEVKEYEKKKKKKVLRQGEWFFIPTGMGLGAFAAEYGSIRNTMRRFIEWRELPVRSGQSNRHACKQIRIDGVPFCYGDVIHELPDGGPSFQHKTVKLGEGIYRAVRNTEVGSWTAKGRVD